MRPILIVSGVLGGGSALVFAVAALVATLFPTGTLVASNPFDGGGMFVKGGVAVPMPAPPVVVNGGGPIFAPDGTLLQPVPTDLIVPPNAGSGG